MQTVAHGHCLTWAIQRLFVCFQRWDIITSAEPFTVSRSTFQANALPLLCSGTSGVSANSMAWRSCCVLMLKCLQAHLAPVMSVDEVHAVLATLLTNNKIQRATHNMMAYRIHISNRNTFLQVGFLYYALQGGALCTSLKMVHAAIPCHRLLVTRGGVCSDGCWVM